MAAYCMLHAEVPLACTSEPCDPCGSLTRSNAGDDHACRHSPPCQSPSTLRLGGVGTNGNILNVVSGGIQPDSPSDDPCSRSALGPDWGCDACRLSPHGKSPLTSRLGCSCTDGNILHVVSGGSPLSSMSDDPCDRSALADDSPSVIRHRTLRPRLAPSEFALSSNIMASIDCGTTAGCGELHPPLSSPEPSTAFIPVPGPKAAMLLPSVQGVNSTSLHGDGSKITSCHVDGTGPPS